MCNLYIDNLRYKNWKPFKLTDILIQTCQIYSHVVEKFLKFLKGSYNKFCSTTGYDWFLLILLHIFIPENFLTGDNHAAEVWRQKSSDLLSLFMESPYD